MLYLSALGKCDVHCADPAPLPSGGPKWRDNFSERSDHPVTPIVYSVMIASTIASNRPQSHNIDHGFSSQPYLLRFWMWRFVTISSAWLFCLGRSLTEGVHVKI